MLISHNLANCSDYDRHDNKRRRRNCYLIEDKNITQVAVIIFSSVRFLLKKITKPNKKKRN